MPNITDDAVARREAARERGRFGEQAHTAPEVELAELHATEMKVGATRVMPPFGLNSIHAGPLVSRAEAAIFRHNVSGIATRIPVVRNLDNPTMDPHGSYALALRSDLTGDTGTMFSFTTGNGTNERVTPNIADALCYAAATAEATGSKVNGKDSDEPTVLDKLIAVIGEEDARDLLAQAYLQYGQFRERTTR